MEPCRTACRRPRLPRHRRRPAWSRRKWPRRALHARRPGRRPTRNRASGPDLAIGHSLGSAALLLALPRLRCARAIHCDPAWVNRPRDLAALRAVKYATWRELRAEHPLWHDEDITAEHRALTTWDPDSVDALAHLPGLPTAAPAVPSWYCSPTPANGFHRPRPRHCAAGAGTRGRWTARDTPSTVTTPPASCTGCPDGCDHTRPLRGG